MLLRTLFIAVGVLLIALGLVCLSGCTTLGAVHGTAVSAVELSGIQVTHPRTLRISITHWVASGTPPGYTCIDTMDTYMTCTAVASRRILGTRYHFPAHHCDPPPGGHGPLMTLLCERASKKD